MEKIRLRETNNPTGLVALVQDLPSSFKGPDEYQIHFDRVYLYSCVFPVIAAWSKRIPDGSHVKLDLSNCKEAARRLVDNIGLTDIVEEGLESPTTVIKTTSNVPLQPIVVGRSTDEVLDRVSKMVDEWTRYDNTDNNTAFRTMLSELAENILVHSEADTPGYVHAKIHKTASGEKCEITFADSGIGILNSYREGTNDEVKSRIEGGASALEIALNGLNSSKPKEVGPGGRSHFGYGLYTVKRLVELNRSRMTLISGDEYVTVDRCRQRLDRLNGRWDGTIVSLIVDLGNPLPLEQVYDEEVEQIVPAKRRKGLGPKSGLSRPADAEIPKTPTPTPTPQPGELRRLVASDVSAQLLSRESGLMVRAELATLLADGSTVEVDLDGIEDITPSVADECFGKLAVRLGEEKFRTRVKIRGGSAILHRLVDFVVRTRLRETSRLSEG